MSNPQATANILAGATFGGGAMEWLAMNSSALTVINVFTTGVGSLALNYWGKRCENQIGMERNRVNRRDITENIIKDLKSAGKEKDYINDFVKIIRD
jgi:hypothetical protein